MANRFPTVASTVAVSINPLFPLHPCGKLGLLVFGINRSGCSYVMLETKDYSVAIGPNNRKSGGNRIADLGTDSMTRILLLSLVLAANSMLAACATTAPRMVDQCLQYNQGMRVTSNREWPAAIGEAEKIKSKMRVESVSISFKGPDEYDRLNRRYRAALSPAIENAGSCYEGSLFQRIVTRLTLSVSALNENAEKGKAMWASFEEKRTVRESAFAKLPSDVLQHKLGDTEISVLSVRSNARFTTIRMRLTNLSVGRIIKPVTGKFWGFDEESPEKGGVAPIGFSLADNFGNQFALHKTHPERMGRSDAGLHPTKSEEYELVFSGYPPESASVVSLTIWRGTFGNQKQYVIKLPRTVFLM